MNNDHELKKSSDIFVTLPKITGLKSKGQDPDYKKHLELVKERKKTINVFIKKTDLDFVERKDRNRRELIQREISKQSSLKDIQVNQKKNFDKKKSKKIGIIFSNEFWSEKYYQKVMKYTHLQNIIDFMKDEKRHKYFENAALNQKLLRKSTLFPPIVFEAQDEESNRFNPDTSPISELFHRKSKSLKHFGSINKSLLELSGEMTEEDLKRLEKEFRNDKIKESQYLIKMCDYVKKENRGLEKAIIPARVSLPNIQVTLQNYEKKQLKKGLKEYFEKKKKKENEKSGNVAVTLSNDVYERNFSSIIALEEEYKRNRKELMVNNSGDKSRLDSKLGEETADVIDYRDTSRILKGVVETGD